MEDLLLLLDYESFSTYQQKVCKYKMVYQCSYEQIIKRFEEKYNFPMHPSTISSVLKRSALGFIWEPSVSKGGAYPFLCERDTEEVKHICRNILQTNDGLDPQEFLDLVREIKIKRLTKRQHFLRKVNA